MEKRKPTSGVSPCGPGVQGLLLLCEEGYEGLLGRITQRVSAIVAAKSLASMSPTATSSSVVLVAVGAVVPSSCASNKSTKD